VAWGNVGVSRSELGCKLYLLLWKIVPTLMFDGSKQWMETQKENLIITKITQRDKPSIYQVTEAGIIGKIGFNSCGVGTCLNAIRVKGVDASHLPVHLGLRMVLESASVSEAVAKLESCGMASSAHILIADANTAIGLEFTSSTFAKCVPDSMGRVLHTNHLLLDHVGAVDTVWLKDSLFRIDRITELSGSIKQEELKAGLGGVSRVFEDEMNYPTSICRAAVSGCESATLFNIVMDLKKRIAIVKRGRPGHSEKVISLGF